MAFNSSTPPSSFFCPSSSSPPSPTHSSSLSATTLADRRQTKTSRYMNSEDFKSTFANKLQALRERERGATHSEPIHSAPSTPTSDTPDTFIPSTYDTFHRHLISQQLDQPHQTRTLQDHLTLSLSEPISLKDARSTASDTLTARNIENYPPSTAQLQSSSNLQVSYSKSHLDSVNKSQPALENTYQPSPSPTMLGTSEFDDAPQEWEVEDTFQEVEVDDTSDAFEVEEQSTGFGTGDTSEESETDECFQQASLDESDLQSYAEDASDEAQFDNVAKEHSSSITLDEPPPVTPQKKMDDELHDQMFSQGANVDETFQESGVEKSSPYESLNENLTQSHPQDALDEASSVTLQKTLDFEPDSDDEMSSEGVESEETPQVSEADESSLHTSLNENVTEPYSEDAFNDSQLGTVPKQEWSSIALDDSPSHMPQDSQAERVSTTPSEPRPQRIEPKEANFQTKDEPSEFEDTPSEPLDEMTNQHDFQETSRQYVSVLHEAMREKSSRSSVCTNFSGFQGSDQHRTDSDDKTGDHSTKLEPSTLKLDFLRKVPQSTSRSLEAGHHQQIEDGCRQLDFHERPRIQVNSETHADDLGKSNSTVSDMLGLNPKPSCDDYQARNEVISKLAEELAQQIEQNDKLSYDLGLLRSTHASLQAAAVDTADELACLREHTRLLLDGHDFSGCEKRRAEAEKSIRDLNQELMIVRRAICRLQLELQAAQPSIDIITSPPLSAEPQSSFDRSLCLSAHSSSHSATFSSNSSNSSLPVSPSTSDPLESNSQDTVDILRAKVARLELELADCRESRLATQTALVAFKHLIDPAKLSPSEPRTPTPRWGIGLGLLSRQSVPATTRPSPPSTQPLSSFSFTPSWSRRSDSMSSQFALGKLFGSSRPDEPTRQSVPSIVDERDEPSLETIKSP